MRLRVSLTSVHQVDDHAEGARNIIERAKACVGAGLDLLSMGDRHTVPEPDYQNVPMIGRLMADWPTDRPVGALFPLPLWHLVTVAEPVATLTTTSEAPFVIQTGTGDGDTFAAMGKNRRRRAKDFDESIRVIKALLAGETVDTERFGIGGARISPLPPTPVEWRVGAGAPVALDQAAREGDFWYGNADLTPERGATAIADYRGMPRQAVAYGAVDDVVEQLTPFKELGFDDVTVRCMAIPQARCRRDPDAVRRRQG